MQMASGAAEHKGFFIWMQQQNADIICIQETKAQLHQLNSDPFCPTRTTIASIMMLIKKAIAGSLYYCRKQPDKIISV